MVGGCQHSGLVAVYGVETEKVLHFVGNGTGRVPARKVGGFFLSEIRKPQDVSEDARWIRSSVGNNSIVKLVFTGCPTAASTARTWRQGRIGRSALAFQTR